jgi:small ligand-binding sensory domain FIST
VTARSFSVVAQGTEALSRALSAARASVRSPAGGLVFAGGALGRRAREIGEILRTVWKGIPAAVVPAAGVLTEAGELEGVGALGGILWSGGAVTPIVVPGEGELAPAGAATGASIRDALVAARAGGASSAMVFPRPDVARGEAFEGALERALDAAGGLCVFGGGTAGPAAVAVTAQGELGSGPVVGLAPRQLASPLVGASLAGRLLCEFATVDESAGGAVLRLGGRPALDALSSCATAVGTSGSAAPLILAAVADPAVPSRFVLRAVRGIDPARRAIVLTEHVAPGALLAFAVRDAAVARSDLEATARRVAGDARGSAPRFALYLTCAGRGQALYGAGDVEARILRQRFGDLPIAGMHSSFEIAPGGDGRARVQTFASVLSLYRSPS